MILLWAVTKNGFVWFGQSPFHWERCTLSSAQTEDGRSKTFKSRKSLSRLNLNSNFLQLVSFKRDLHWILPSSRLMKLCFIGLKRVFFFSNQWKQRFTDNYQTFSTTWTNFQGNTKWQKSICSSLIGVRESIKSEKRLRNCVKQQLTFSFKVYRETISWAIRNYTLTINIQYDILLLNINKYL